MDANTNNQALSSTAPAADAPAIAPAVAPAIAPAKTRRRTRNGPVSLRTRVAPRHTAERNAVVRKVMTEKSLSMIEASKYVKANNLWKGDALAK
jgi:hypothetical protein